MLTRFNLVLSTGRTLVQKVAGCLFPSKSLCRESVPGTDLSRPLLLSRAAREPVLLESVVVFVVSGSMCVLGAILGCPLPAAHTWLPGSV